MGKRLLFAAFVSVACSACGCRVTEVAEIQGIQAGWQVVGPRYVEYLKADPQLQARPDILADRVKTADDLTQAIDTLAAKVKGGVK